MAPPIDDRLRDLRKRSLMSQRELAKRSGVGVTTIVRIKRTQVEPQGATILKLAEAPDVEPRDLLADLYLAIVSGGRYHPTGCG